MRFFDRFWGKEEEEDNEPTRENKKMGYYVTHEMFKAVAPRADAGLWVPLLNELLPKWNISTEKRVKMFLAQTAHESSGYTVFEENLKYSASRLLEVFGKYFRNRNAWEYQYNEEKIANVVYSNRMGNGSESSGDGYKFRGRGVIQLTGKNNYTMFANAMDITICEAIEYIEMPKGALEAACWFWYENKLNYFADRRDVRGATKRINGGYNGLDDRIYYWNKLYAISGATNAPRKAPEEPMRESRIKRTLRIGDKGEDVKILQRALQIKDDGDFGPVTRGAVRAFQRSRGLSVDGIVGPNTRRELGV